MEQLNLNDTFSILINRANDIQAKCKDDIVAASDLHMADDLTINGMMLSPLAEGHLCGKLQVPSRYFTRLVDAGLKPLAAENINAWLTEDEKRKFMLRQYDGHIRGVLSGSYSQYDAPEILNSVRDVFGDGRFTLKGSFINEERLHVRLVEQEMLPIDGEDLFAGITIDSSDVGRSGLYASFLIYKQVCTNGLKIAQSKAEIFRQKHIGITSEEFKAGLEDGFKLFDDLKIEVAEMIEQTRKIPLSGDIEEMQKKLKEQTKLSEDDVVEVFDLMGSKYDNNMWGLINGITEVAQKFTLERRLELETMAGQMLA